ncbi:MAG: hypothetical protein QOE42_192 [Chloroflexota bacterium]|jgi:hypothetical protein|nr:hypothetical protein [Chloroflexota bacterium]
MSRGSMNPGFDQRIAEWLEDDPDDAPDSALTTVLAAFPSIPQRRATRVPWRNRPMTQTARLLAGAAAVAVVLIAGALILRPATSPSVGGDATPSPPPSSAIGAGPSAAPSDALAQLQAYRAAVGAVCNSLASVPDPAPSAGPNAVVAFLQATIARQTTEAAGLEAIQPPAAMRTEHLANIQTVKDVSALLNHEIELVQANPPKLVEAAAVDDATASLNTLREQFARKYALPPCP